MRADDDLWAAYKALPSKRMRQPLVATARNLHEQNISKIRNYDNTISQLFPN